MSAVHGGRIAHVTSHKSQVTKSRWFGTNNNVTASVTSSPEGEANTSQTLDRRTAELLSFFL